jgi:hypothetical protein
VIFIVILIVILIGLTFTGCNKNLTPKKGTETSKIILSVLNDSTNNDHICRRVKEITDGNMTKEQCLENLPTSKEKCGGIINNYVGLYVTDEEVSKWVVQKTIFCQVWTVLDYETIVNERGINYVKKENGVLP